MLHSKFHPRKFIPHRTVTLTSYYRIVHQEKVNRNVTTCVYTCKIDNSSILRQTERETLHNRSNSKRGYYSRIKLMPDYWDETTLSRNRFAV